MATLLTPTLTLGFAFPNYGTSIVERRRKCRRIKCIQNRVDKLVLRRSANYEPPICDFDFVQSLKSKYGDLRYIERAENLKDYARSLLENERDASSSLDLVDTLQRLDLSQQFEEDINKVIEDKVINQCKEEDLHYTALKFRILRQNGHFVSQDVFTPFLDKNGDFKEAFIRNPKAVLSLYDASYLGMDGEPLMDTARAFAAKNLREFLNKGPNYPDLELHKFIQHGLEQPYYLKPQRQEARWFIQEYEANKKKNSKLLELAKLEYNICQAGYIKSVQAMSRWWNDRGLGEQLPFIRDRVPECFLWAHEIVANPKHPYATEMLTVAIQLVATTDDIFDVYGTFEESALFASAVERWDIRAVEELPEYMRPCYLVLFNYVNEVAYTISKFEGHKIISFLSKLWADLCKAYLQEAEWFHGNLKPTFAEYMNNAWISVTGPVLLSTLFILRGQETTKERLLQFKTYPDSIRASSYAFRLLNDLGTSNDELARGDALKAVQCYMHEKGVSQEVAREHAQHEISESWKKLNREFLLGSKYPKDLVISSMNIVRAASWFYATGDGFGSEREKTFGFFESAIVNPIPDLRYIERVENLKDYGRSLLEKERDASSSLELVDTVQRLDLSQQFVEDINKVIEHKVLNQCKVDLYYTALKFRILRRNGHFVSQGEI